jgi:hypothetical protein
LEILAPGWSDGIDALSQCDGAAFDGERRPVARIGLDDCHVAIRPCGEQHLQRYLHEFDFRYSNRAKLGIDDAWLTKPKTIRQQALAFIRWRKAKGYEITPFRRQFWGKKAWHKQIAWYWNC